MIKWLRDWLKTRDWLALYNYVKSTGNFESDQQLADAMGVGKNLISDFKNGRKDLTWKAQLRLLDLAGYTQARDIMTAMLPPETKKAAIEKHNKVLARVNRPRGGKQSERQED
ncbi:MULTISPECIES: hypothetical protein [Burkholderia cepacia complex]|uniref:hypothetical protein n=1 Tax=Burkholderia cepacia complex TaxID=87882 RepID=UPI000760A401|nr:MULTISPECIES: hypothetical protein [Burkholderia cepacia complex]KVZ17635.1 hypothetical protein WL14_31280 [Burkholderia cepacia]MCA8093596.1 hypothetical protein [Burkholderia anthina]MDN7616601.1 hypothetical protein [Burkholderia cepacia]